MYVVGTAYSCIRKRIEARPQTVMKCEQWAYGHRIKGTHTKYSIILHMCGLHTTLSLSKLECTHIVNTLKKNQWIWSSLFYFSELNEFLEIILHIWRSASSLADMFHFMDRLCSVFDCLIAIFFFLFHAIWLERMTKKKTTARDPYTHLWPNSIIQKCLNIYQLQSSEK